MGDVIARLGDSVIQHGPDSDRVYLMKLADTDGGAAAGALEAKARREGYGKVFAKVPERFREAFESAGYVVEATIPGYFRGEEDGHFMALYLDPDRRSDPRRETVDEVLQAARARTPKEKTPACAGEGYELRACTPDDAQEMAGVYREVFETYPFPIHDPDYIRQTMSESFVYFGVWSEEGLIALSSSEMDEEALAVEMTDFATLPPARGQGCGRALLDAMEAQMRRRGLVTAFTIARAVSAGMNIVFADLGYAYGGTLVNNTNISGSLESMNVWYKPLAGAGPSA
jgi:putative beta-lysine N-acetyltransferase